jgi:hypothetical protein
MADTNALRLRKSENRYQQDKLDQHRLIRKQHFAEILKRNFFAKNA